MDTLDFFQTDFDKLKEVIDDFQVFVSDYQNVMDSAKYIKARLSSCKELLGEDLTDKLNSFLTKELVDFVGKIDTLNELYKMLETVEEQYDDSDDDAFELDFDDDEEWPDVIDSDDYKED